MSASKVARLAFGGAAPEAIEIGASQSVAYTATAGVVSNAFASGVSMIRVVLTTAGFIAIGTAPTATVNDVYVPANVPCYFAVPNNGTYKISAIRLSADGTLYVTEAAKG